MNDFITGLIVGALALAVTFLAFKPITQCQDKKVEILHLSPSTEDQFLWLPEKKEQIILRPVGVSISSAGGDKEWQQYRVILKDDEI